MNWDEKRVEREERIVMKGVGEYEDWRSGIDEEKGMVEEMKDKVLKKESKLIGIWVGMKIM